MPTDTDRKKIKDQQKGYFVTAAGIASSSNEVTSMHSRSLTVNRTYAANDAAAFTQRLSRVKRKSRLSSLVIDSIAEITGNATNYEVFTFSTRLPNGDAGVTLGTYNTHTGAGSTITANVPKSVTIVTNTDAEIAANSQILVAMAPQGTGWNVAYTGVTFTLDLEEI